MQRVYCSFSIENSFIDLKKLPVALLFLLVNFNFGGHVLLRNVQIIVIFIIGFRGEYVLELVGLNNKTDNALFVVVSLYKSVETLNLDQE